MLRQARVAREMAIDFPCFIKRKNIKTIGKIFIISSFFNESNLYGYLMINLIKGYLAV